MLLYLCFKFSLKIASILIRLVILMQYLSTVSHKLLFYYIYISLYVYFQLKNRFNQFETMHILKQSNTEGEKEREYVGAENILSFLF